MTPLLFALALLAEPPAPEQSMTAGQLYPGCVRYAARGPASSDPGDNGDVMCAAEIAVAEVTEAAEAAMEAAGESRSRTRRFCLPENLLNAEDPDGAVLARAFIAYVDRNPASRDLDYDEVFQRALAEKWPCPR